MPEDNLADLHNDQLLALIKTLGTRVSCFNAAEGQSYIKETHERNEAKKAFWDAWQVARERGLNPDCRGFLL